MKVADLMTGEVRSCTIHDSLNGAARIMWDHDCGCAPVVDAHGKLVGIVTDRDISMAAYTQGVPLQAIPVERVMSKRVVSCSRTDELETTHQLMRTHEIHRIPVVDARGRLIGIVTLSDLLNHSRANGAEPSAAIEIAATFSAIHRRRVPATVSSNGDSGPREPAKAPKKPGGRGKKSAANLR